MFRVIPDRSVAEQLVSQQSVSRQPDRAAAAFAAVFEPPMEQRQAPEKLARKRASSVPEDSAATRRKKKTLLSEEFVVNSDEAAGPSTIKPAAPEAEDPAHVMKTTETVDPSEILSPSDIDEYRRAAKRSPASRSVVFDELKHSDTLIRQLNLSQGSQSTQTQTQSSDSLASSVFPSFPYLALTSAKPSRFPAFVKGIVMGVENIVADHHENPDQDLLEIVEALENAQGERLENAKGERLENAQGERIPKDMLIIGRSYLYSAVRQLRESPTMDTDAYFETRLSQEESSDTFSLWEKMEEKETTIKARPTRREMATSAVKDQSWYLVFEDLRAHIQSEHSFWMSVFEGKIGPTSSAWWLHV